MRNDRAMIQWMCRTSISNGPPIEVLLKKLDIRDLDDLIHERRLRWYGHVERASGEINRVRTMPIPGKRGPGRPAMTWDELGQRCPEQNTVENIREESICRLPHFVGARAPEERGLPHGRPAYPLQYKNKTGFD